MPGSLRLPVSLIIVACSALQAQAFESVVIKSFGASNHEGTRPRGTLVEAAGKLYGTTHTGGAFGRGTVFRVNVEGTGFQTLHSFNPANRGGHTPEAGLILGRDGTLYGTTAASGSGLSGTIFSVGTNGTGYKVLRDLDGPKDGREPRARVMEGSDGLLYGIATMGGPSGGGTVFRLKTDGSGFKVLHAFKLAALDGTTPLAELIEGEDQTLYGTTAGGGNGQSGVVFKLNRDGGEFKVLHRFGADGNDGRIPNDPLLELEGILYGTTSAGGPVGSGTIFTLKPDGSNYKVLYYFNLDNREPKGLIRHRDSLMGTASGGMFRAGIIFQYSFDGAYNVVHQFGRLGLNSAANDGSVPAAGLIITEDGKVYGATEGGGAFGLGTVFRFD